MVTQDERRRTTRAAIVRSARKRFLADGFGATSVADIQAGAGVSRGAIYHHFPTKESIFEAIFESEAAGAMHRAVREIPDDVGPRSRLVIGCTAWLTQVADPDVAEIVLAMGHEVLGWRQSRRLEEPHSLALISAGLELAVDAGEVALDSTQMTARFVNAILAEVAWAIHLGGLPLAEAEVSAAAAIEALLGPTPNT